MALPDKPQPPPVESECTSDSVRLATSRFRAIVENAPDVIALIDVRGNIHYVNAHTERVLGYSKCEMEAHNVFDFIHPEDTTRAAQEYSHTLLQAGEKIPSVLRLRDVTGKWIPFEILANNRLKDPDVQAVIFTARDLRFRNEIVDAILRFNIDNELGVENQVTALGKINAELRVENQARREAERRLQHTISLLNATLDSTADGILVVSNDGKVVSCNRKFMEMWQLGCDSSVGKDDQTLLAHVITQLQSPNEFLEKIQALYADPSAISSDILHFKDGRIFERYSQPQQLENRIVGRVWSFRDVTRARNMEMELRQSQKMEALGRLAGGIAHDFNNLLMLVSGYVNQILDNPALVEGHGTCEQILTITKRAASVTRQLLTFSRKLPDVPVAADLNAIVLDVEQMIRRLLSDQVQLQISAWRDALPIYIDVSQIELMIMNFAINAQDAMPNGGLLSIATAAEAAADETGSHRYAVLQVSDTGHGMTPEIQAHIFEPFFTTKQLGRGTGLGLSTVFGIVDRAGGFIKVQSQPNRGTTFRVYLPQDTAIRLAKPPEPSVKPAHGGNETILLAEDEAGIRTMTKVYLEGLGYRVLEAGDGAEAIERSQEYSGVIDLILTDILMPGVRGDIAVEEIRKSRPGTKAIFISGYTDQSAQREVDDILFKPFEFPELGRKIRAVLDASSAAVENPPGPRAA
jgi:two-component system cell cycle sensor histidine kinase/response regulator CckA